MRPRDDQRPKHESGLTGVGVASKPSGDRGLVQTVVGDLDADYHRLADGWSRRTYRSRMIMMAELRRLEDAVRPLGRVGAPLLAAVKVFGSRIRDHRPA